VARGVTEFVQRRAVPVDRVEIGLGRGHPHVVLRRNVKGAIAADPEIHLGRMDERLDPGLDQAGWGRGRDRQDALRQVVTLGGVEDGEALEERNGARVAPSVVCPLLLVVGHEAVGVDDGRAALTFPYVASKGEGLAESQPALRRVAALDHRSPKDQDVDPGVAAARGGVSWQVQGGLR
jgi:hypothetical protein